MLSVWLCLSSCVCAYVWNCLYVSLCLYFHVSLWWCIYGGVSVVVYLWWCLNVSMWCLYVSVWWCLCGGVSMCFCGGGSTCLFDGVSSVEKWVSLVARAMPVCHVLFWLRSFLFLCLLLAQNAVSINWWFSQSSVGGESERPCAQLHGRERWCLQSQEVQSRSRDSKMSGRIKTDSVNQCKTFIVSLS